MPTIKIFEINARGKVMKVAAYVWQGHPRNVVFDVHVDDVVVAHNISKAHALGMLAFEIAEVLDSMVPPSEDGS